MTALDEANLLDDRYAVYELHRPYAARIDRDELWFFEPADCRSILDSPCLSSKRSRLAQRAEMAGFPIVGEFFRQWLMYTDGDEHLTRRSAVTRALRRVLTGTIIQPPQINLGATFELVGEYCEPFVWSVLPQLLGLSVEEQEFWKPRVELLVGLPGTEESDLEALRMANLALNELHEFLKRRPCLLLSLLTDTLGEGTDPVALANLAINVVGDGIHPTIAALATEILHHLAKDTTPNRFAFHRDPPFQFAARLVSSDTAIGGVGIQKGRRVVACLAAANRRASVEATQLPLTFGHGRHACVGRAHAERCVESGMSTFTELTHGTTATTIEEPQWIKSIGYRMIHTLRIKRAPV